MVTHEVPLGGKYMMEVNCGPVGIFIVCWVHVGRIVLFCAARWTKMQTWTKVGMDYAGFIARKVGQGRGLKG